LSGALDKRTLDLLDGEREVDIITVRPDGRRVRTTLWVVVDGDDAFLRSWRGPRARWFQAALDRPQEVELMAAGQRLVVRPVLATDDVSIARCSSALERKYAGDPATDSMIREEILETTLRLEPRGG
jgi:hypothetical protein